MNKRILAGLAASALVSGSALLAGCTTAVPALSECAATTNGGFGSSGQGITSIVHPGGKVSVGSGETAHYWPCNARNFVTGPGGDRKLPDYAVRTGSSGKGATLIQGMPVYVYSGIYFTANENDNAIKQFLPFCLKYTCATPDSEADTSTAALAHSSEPGWENMLLENMGPAIDRASVKAVAQFPPTLWQDASDWAHLSDLIAANLNSELSTETESSTPFFCGANSTMAKCDQMTVVVTNVVPEDSSVVKIYNQQITAEQSAAANAARLKAATALYGNQAGYWLGLQDTEANCPKCTFYIGNPGTTPVPAK